MAVSPNKSGRSQQVVFHATAITISCAGLLLFGQSLVLWARPSCPYHSFHLAVAIPATETAVKLKLNLSTPPRSISAVLFWLT